jgi:hypothetical protein
VGEFDGAAEIHDAKELLGAKVVGALEGLAFGFLVGTRLG